MLHSLMRLLPSPPRAVRRFSTALSAAHARGTMSILRPERTHLSPALGLLCLSSSVFVGNIYRCEAAADLGIGLGQAHLLARDLFHPVGDSLKATRSRSQAAYYLDPTTTGHILGLALINAPQTALRAKLKQCGIRNNKYRGAVTGVSLVRYTRIAHLISESLNCEWSPVIPLLLRFVWEKATSKQCLLDFLLALDSHYPVLLPGFRDNSLAQMEWLEQRFDPSELSDNAVTQAAQIVLDPTNSTFSHSMELLATSLSVVHAFKPAIAMQRHCYKNGTKVIGDCVEVVLREIFDLLLFDPNRLIFDYTRLPGTTLPQLLAFYQEPQHDADLASKSWYKLCQELPSCEYIEKTPEGEAYELFPSLQSISKAVGVLLGQRWASFEELERNWNTWVDHDPRMTLKVQISQTVSRNLLNDEKALRQVAELTLGYNHHFIRVCLEGSRHFASVTHCQKSNVWRDDIRDLHMQMFLSARISPSLQCLWPLCLGSLTAWPTTSKAQLVYSILCTPLDLDRFRWWPTQDLQNGANVDLNSASAAKMRNDQLAIKSLEIVLNSKDLSRELLPWIISNTSTLDTLQVSLALARASSELLASPKITSAILGRPDGAFLARLVSFGRGNSSFLGACVGLSPTQLFQLSRFWFKLNLCRQQATVDS